MGISSKFQFPSNGKAHPNEKKILENHHVSIPFKREGASKHRKKGDRRRTITGGLFQFPSNGKAHPNESFNFLQTGRRIQTTDRTSVNEKMPKFQFPSNGKAHPNFICSSDRFSRWQIRVSIPFKREGASKLSICLF